MSTFTQKHYEHMIDGLRSLRSLPLSDHGVTSEELNASIIVMCRIFERDNPKFKRELFIQLCNERKIT